MEKNGFSKLHPNQVELVYGSASPFNNSDAVQRLSSYVQNSAFPMTEEDPLIRSDIAALASSQEMVKNRRQKRTVLLTPVVLAPRINDVGEKLLS
jgi:hypothetical protein